MPRRQFGPAGSHCLGTQTESVDLHDSDDRAKSLRPSHCHITIRQSPCLSHIMTLTLEIMIRALSNCDPLITLSVTDYDPVAALAYAIIFTKTQKGVEWPLSISPKHSWIHLLASAGTAPPQKRHFPRKMRPRNMELTGLLPRNTDVVGGKPRF